MKFVRAFHICILFAGICIAFSTTDITAQNRSTVSNKIPIIKTDTLQTTGTIKAMKQGKDVSIFANNDTTHQIDLTNNSLLKKTKIFTVQNKIPDPKRALWLSLVLPGAGQIYNRKYWKLPIIYGGFIGCTYALLWNQQMYKDYSQAYIDIMDDDPNTASYKNILPLGYDITGREDQFKQIFKHKKDFYRKNRDLSVFAFFGVYLLSVIDSYVDAQLSTFDISPDLSLHVTPTVIEQNTVFKQSNTIGVQCNLNF